MHYQLLALDIDGTLYTSDGRITPRVKKAIRDAVDRGCFVLLATGRMYRAMAHINELLGLSMPCMVYGGAQIVKDGEIIYSRPVDSAVTNEVLNWAHDNGIHAQVYENQCVFYEKANRYTDDYEQFYDVPGYEQPDIRQRIDIQTPKVLIIGEPEDVLSYEKMAKERFGNRLKISRSKPHLLELNNPDASKGNALDYLAKSLGLTADNCMAIGDAPLDLPMIEFAGLGVAMGNADEATKHGADIICPTNDEDGVAVIIEEYILNQP